MNAQHLSREQLIEKLAALQQEVANLKNAQIALDTQSEMLENLLEMAETPEIEEILKVTLQQALNISSKLTGAECSCVVLLNQNGIATTILNLHDLNPLQQQNLISSVLNVDYVSWVESHRQIALIADTLHDARWRVQPDQPEAPRSVLGVPILKKQVLLGILTLTHSQPGHFSAESVNLMQLIAKPMALAVEYARFYGQLETYSQMLKINLEKGREMQLNFLPEPLMYLPGWEIATFFKAARQVSGDFYDVFLLPDGSVGLVIGDVCDKGVEAALFMALFRSLLRLFSAQYSLSNNGNLSSPGAVDQALSSTDALKAIILTNNYIAQNHPQLFMFATIFFGVLNPATGMMTYINGGHEPPIILRASGAKERLNPTGPAVGPMPNQIFQVRQVQFEPGDILIGYSDGVTDARSPQRNFFTEKQLLSLLAPAPTATIALERIKEKLLSHMAETEPYDDITILAVQYSPLSSTN